MFTNCGLGKNQALRLDSLRTPFGSCGSRRPAVGRQHPGAFQMHSGYRYIISKADFHRFQARACFSLTKSVFIHPQKKDRLTFTLLVFLHRVFVASPWVFSGRHEIALQRILSRLSALECAAYSEVSKKACSPVHQLLFNPSFSSTRSLIVAPISVPDSHRIFLRRNIGQRLPLLCVGFSFWY